MPHTAVAGWGEQLLALRRPTLDANKQHARHLGASRVRAPVEPPLGDPGEENALEKLLRRPGRRH
eukprot:7246149-Lingulodinium_polyedra.AAC.1